MTLLDYLMITEEAMPKYKFSCSNCTREWWQWMGMNDPSPEICPHCDWPSPTKVPTLFSMKEEEVQPNQVGDKVEQAIIDSGRELKEEKKKIKSKTYDDI